MIPKIKRLARRIIGGGGTNVRIDRELMLRYAAHAVDPKGVFVDVGAGTGATARRFVEMAGFSPGNSFLLEPDPANFSILAEESPGYRNLQLGIAEQSGSMTLYSVDDPKWNGSSKSNTLYREVLAEKFPNHTITEHHIETLTMDDFCRREKIEKIEFVFFNCEGAEYDIFAHNANWLSNTRMVWVDFHGRSPVLHKRFAARRQDMYALFEHSGFSRVGGHKKEDIDGAKGHLTFLWERLDWVANK